MTVGKDVFKCFLKVDEDSEEVTSEGKPFQTWRAATPKTRSPTVFSLERRTTSLWLDRSRLCESSSTAHCKSLQVARYSGAMLLRQRNTRTARRNAIRSRMHSQCRSCSRGVIRSYFCPLHTNLAATLSTDCRWSCKRPRYSDEVHTAVI